MIVFPRLTRTIAFVLCLIGLSALQRIPAGAVDLTDAALNKVRFYDSSLTYTDGVVLWSKRAQDSASYPQDREQCLNRCKANKICYSYVWNTIDRVCEFKSGANLV